MKLRALLNGKVEMDWCKLVESHFNKIGMGHSIHKAFFKPDTALLVKNVSIYENNCLVVFRALEVSVFLARGDTLEVTATLTVSKKKNVWTIGF